MLNTALTYLEFIAADENWFNQNPDRTFNYHLTSPSIAAQIANQGPMPTVGNEKHAKDLFVLAVRATEGIVHCVVGMSIEEAQGRLRLASGHVPDAYGYWLLSAAVPLMPRPRRSTLVIGPELKGFIADMLRIAEAQS